MPPPVPPQVKEGRMMAGKHHDLERSIASSNVPRVGLSRESPILSIRSRKS